MNLLGRVVSRSAGREDQRLRHTEFWARMESALGPAYARSWAGQHVLASLGGRTVEESLASGESPKHVWRAVCDALELPAAKR